MRAPRTDPQHLPLSGSVPSSVSLQGLRRLYGTSLEHSLLHCGGARVWSLLGETKIPHATQRARRREGPKSSRSPNSHHLRETFSASPDRKHLRLQTAVMSCQHRPELRACTLPSVISVQTQSPSETVHYLKAGAHCQRRPQDGWGHKRGEGQNDKNKGNFPRQ